MKHKCMRTHTCTTCCQCHPKEDSEYEELTRLPLPGFTEGHIVSLLQRQNFGLARFMYVPNTFPVLQAWMKEP